MKTLIRSASLLLATFLCVAGATSAAAAPRVSTVLILPDGDEGADLLLANSADSLRELNIGITEFDDATLAGFELQPALDCLSDEDAEDCSDVVNMVPAEWVLVLQIRRVSDNPDSDQRVVAKLYAAKSADLLQVEQRVCQRCSSAERMATLIRELVADMAKGQLAEKAHDTYLDVQSDPASAILSIDDVVVGPTGTAYRVTPGEHRIVIQQKGYRKATQVVLVGANEHKALTVSLDAKPKPDGTQRMLGWISLGVGAAALGAGGIQVLRDEGEPDEGAPRESSRRDTMGQGIVGLAAGTVLVGVGAALLLTADSSEDDQPDAVSFLAQPNAGGFSLGLTGRF